MPIEVSNVASNNIATNCNKGINRNKYRTEIVIGSTIAGGISTAVSVNVINAQDFPQEVKQMYMDELYTPFAFGLTLYSVWLFSVIRKATKRNIEEKK